MDDLGLAALVRHLRGHPRNDVGDAEHLPQENARGSPLSRSDRVSMVKDRLKRATADRAVSPMRASVAAGGVFLKI